jgi:hypothetical protein
MTDGNGEKSYLYTRGEIIFSVSASWDDAAALSTDVLAALP